ncbi:MAG: diguanylate cyclase [Rhodoferax sp.]
MKTTGKVTISTKASEQSVRLRRFYVGIAAHVMNLAFVLLCWVLGFLPTDSVMAYTVIAVVFNGIVYGMLRSGLNLRFKDPSLTFLQIAVPAMMGLYIMYFAGLARGAFLLLGLAMFSFGMFRFKAHGFVRLAIFILMVYALQIGLLIHFHADGANLKLELLLWFAFAMALGQFSFLAAMVGSLRHKVGEKNQALAKQNAELEVALQRISDMAIRDELTGVYNRRYLMERLTEETHRCQRSGSVFCICMVDIDFFKRVNDVYGHLPGDEVLRSVATAASKALRQLDFFGRYGGEEFIMVLTDTALEGAMVTAERVRQRVEQLLFPSIAPDLHITVSIGVAEHVRRADSAATLQRADDALYAAKAAGRNRSVAAPLGDSLHEPH